MGVVSLMIRPFYSRYPLEKKLCGPQSLSGRDSEEAMVDTEIGFEDVNWTDLAQDRV
jgi:hypothetical protein